MTKIESKPYSNPELFKKTLQNLLANKHNKMQELSQYSFEKLYEMRQYYYDWAKGAEELGAIESSTINGEKLMQIDEAIEIKKGKEEEIWDSLT